MIFTCMFFLHTIKLQSAFWMPDNDSAPWLHHTIIPGFTLYNINCLSCSLNREISGLFYILCMIKLIWIFAIFHWGRIFSNKWTNAHLHCSETLPLYTQWCNCSCSSSHYFLVHFTFPMFFSQFQLFLDTLLPSNTDLWNLQIISFCFSFVVIQ